ncbi:hypothetical protein [Nonomuraea rubra]|uniref:hypothetical protein n=1 Tax=Nonomuraea rubra TaxID=46180 RepID=UPI0033E4DC40
MAAERHGRLGGQGGEVDQELKLLAAGRQTASRERAQDRQRRAELRKLLVEMCEHRMASGWEQERQQECAAGDRQAGAQGRTAAARDRRAARRDRRMAALDRLQASVDRQVAAGWRMILFVRVLTPSVRPL